MPRLHVVTGKGGVGKSTVAAALALAAAETGARTLAIEIPTVGGLTRILGAPPAAPGIVAEVGERLAVTHFDGATALSEYLTRRVWLGGLRDRVLDHPLFRAFVAAAPGVQELMAIGKVRDELLLRRESMRHPWDVIVLDAGASGHALPLLRMPAAAARTFGGGRVHGEATQIDAMLRDPGTTRIHVVATPDEMPLVEAAQIVEVVRDELRMPLGRVFVNRCREAVPAGLDDALARLDAVQPRLAAAAALATVARWEAGWATRQERGIAGVEDRTGRRVVRLPRLVAATDDRARAQALVAAVQEAVS